MKKQKFLIGDTVSVKDTDITGTITKAFWADAGDPTDPAYSKRSEHWRYYVRIGKFSYSVPEKYLFRINAFSGSMKSGTYESKTG